MYSSFLHRPTANIPITVIVKGCYVTPNETTTTTQTSTTTKGECVDSDGMENPKVGTMQILL